MIIPQQIKHYKHTYLNFYQSRMTNSGSGSLPDNDDRGNITL